jgi:hypothetical protein
MKADGRASGLRRVSYSNQSECGERRISAIAKMTTKTDNTAQNTSFVYDGEPHPVELLRDQRGIYGIGVSDSFDFEAIAWSCGIEPEPHTFERSPRALILRPDRLPDTRPRRAVLQKIAGGFRRGPFMHTHEEQLRRFIHHEALNRAALPWPRPPADSPSGFAQWWSADKKQQARNRGIYHGLRLLSLHVVNHLIGAALEAAGDADAVKAARRFAFEHRESIYRAGALSRRALQLAETFPVLALAIYAEDSRVCHYGNRRDAAELRVRQDQAIKFNIYSIRRNGDRVATLALGRDDGRAYLEQIRGPCNTGPPKPIVATVQRWLCAQKPLPPRGVLPATDAEWRAA